MRRTRTYYVTLENRGDKEVEREMSSEWDVAREEASEMCVRALARGNDAWILSSWVARNGDAFYLRDDGAVEDMTDRDYY